MDAFICYQHIILKQKYMRQPTSPKEPVRNRLCRTFVRLCICPFMHLSVYAGYLTYIWGKITLNLTFDPNMTLNHTNDTRNKFFASKLDKQLYHLIYYDHYRYEALFHPGRQPSRIFENAQA